MISWNLDMLAQELRCPSGRAWRNRYGLIKVFNHSAMAGTFRWNFNARGNSCYLLRVFAIRTLFRNVPEEQSPDLRMLWRWPFLPHRSCLPCLEALIMDCFSPKGHVVCYPTVVRAPSMSERTKSLGIIIVKVNSLSLYWNIAVTIRE